jgi:hypothetical protein
VSIGSSFSTFNTSTGDYTFVSQDAMNYPPDNYVFTISIVAGDQTQTATFTLTLQYPTFALISNPFSDYTHNLKSPSYTMQFSLETMVTPINLDNAGSIRI